MASRRSSSGPGSGPGGRRPHRPGTRSAGGARARDAVTGDETARIAPAADAPRASATSRVRRLRDRVTGRAVVLVVVLLMLAMSFGSSLKAYVVQRGEIQALKDEIATRQAAIDDLEQEKTRWDDPAYVEQQARARLGYVMPGERSYVVLGEDGEPLQSSEAELADPDERIHTAPTPWWSSAWASVELAGHPPKAKPQEKTVPATKIEAPADEESR